MHLTLKKRWNNCAYETLIRLFQKFERVKTVCEEQVKGFAILNRVLQLPHVLRGDPEFLKIFAHPVRVVGSLLLFPRVGKENSSRFGERTAAAAHLQH